MGTSQGEVLCGRTHRVGDHSSYSADKGMGHPSLDNMTWHRIEPAEAHALDNHHIHGVGEALGDSPEEGSQVCGSLEGAVADNRSTYHAEDSSEASHLLCKIDSPAAGDNLSKVGSYQSAGRHSGYLRGGRFLHG